MSKLTHRQKRYSEGYADGWAGRAGIIISNRFDEDAYDRGYGDGYEDRGRADAQARRDAGGLG